MLDEENVSNKFIVDLKTGLKQDKRETNYHIPHKKQLKKKEQINNLSEVITATEDSQVSDTQSKNYHQLEPPSGNATSTAHNPQTETSSGN